MNSLIRAVIARLRTPKPKLLIPKTLWNDLCSDLQSSSAGRRESGAFLLGNKNEVKTYVLYENLGENCLFQGAIRLTAGDYGRLWDICREESMEPIADVHTHPGREFQSDIDRANPMVAQRGHIGLIIPFFAFDNPTPSTTGVYQYLGPNQWRTIPVRKRHKAILLTGE